VEDDLQEQLLTITTPELAELYIRVLDLFDAIDVTTHIDSIEQHLGITDYQTGGEFNNMIRDTLERQLTYEIGRFAITLNPEVPYDIEFCTELLRALYHIDDYPDGKAMLEALQSEEGDVRETLYRVIALINPIDEDEFFMQVSEVSPALVVRLNSTREQLPDGITEKVNRLRDYIRTRTRRVLPALQSYYDNTEGDVISDVILHVESTQLGYDLQPALALLSLRILQQPLHEAIADFALLCVGSNISNPAMAFEILMGHYIDDLSKESTRKQISDCVNILREVPTNE